ncbi:MAG: 3-oxoacyl-[acyl-carrier-protein] synthase III C-terminal domain-containing protein [Saprospiraceae bacterium]
MKKGNTIIESIGDYLPPTAVSSQEILDGCVNSPRFPLERVSGIKERRMAGVEEFALDLAIKAIKACLNNSKYTVKDIDLVICCNISHYDKPARYSFEPSGAIKLHKEFGFDQATVFDISNACAGVFTGIYIADAYLKAGAAKRVMVVSGEYITHLTKNAQKEITDFRDPRMACLTLGDSGVALILEQSDREDVGFHKMEMLTLGDHSELCIAKQTDFSHGGAIMLTESARLAEVAVKEGSKQLARMITENANKEVDILLTHQTSTLSIQAGIKEVNRLLEKQKFSNENTINNLAERGNTSSTSHIVAIMDNIRKHNFKDGQNILFSVNASGVTLGASLYTFDDLPTRLLNGNGHLTNASANGHDTLTPARLPKRVVIDSIGTIPSDVNIKKSTFDLSNYVAKACLDQSGMSGDDIDLLLFAGVYRDEFICEPAIAALLAGDIKMRSDNYKNATNSFALDVMNGALGFLNAIDVASNMINSGKATNVMVLTAEIENNKETIPDVLIGLEETASGMILRKAAANEKGFSDIFFEKFPDFIDKIDISSTWEKGITVIDPFIDEQMEEIFVACIVETINKAANIKGLLKDNKITKIIPQQISASFILKLSKAMGLPKDLFVDARMSDKDLFTSSIAYGMDQMEGKPGDIALIIGVGSGVQVGCALYHY